MNILRKFLIFSAFLVVSACANLTGGGAGGNGGVDPGSASDPTSPAFFQQAIGDRILFVVNESSLSSEAQSILSGQAQWLLTNAEYSIVIEGHADEQGTREYNLALGERRANSAREFLVSRGVAESRLKVVSFGKERPAETCSDESCYSQNRRAVTVLSSDLTG